MRKWLLMAFLNTDGRCAGFPQLILSKGVITGVV